MRKGLLGEQFLWYSHQELHLIIGIKMERSGRWVFCEILTQDNWIEKEPLSVTDTEGFHLVLKQLPASGFSHMHYNMAFQDMKSTFHKLCKSNSILSLHLFFHFLQNCQTCTFEKRNNSKSTFRISIASKLVSLVYLRFTHLEGNIFLWCHC